MCTENTIRGIYFIRQDNNNEIIRNFISTANKTIDTINLFRVIPPPRDIFPLFLLSFEFVLLI